VTWRVHGDGLPPVELDDWSAGLHAMSWEIGSPQVRAITSLAPGRDGTRDRTRRVGARAVTVNIAAVAGPSSLRHLVDRLAPYCDVSRRFRLTHTDPDTGAQRSLQVRSDGELGQSWDTFTWMSLPLGFVTVGLPFWRGADRVVSLGFTEDQGEPGITFPVTFPVAFPGGTPGADSGIVHNAGSAAAPWTATIEGPATALRLENVTHGTALQLFPMALGPGETMILDSYERSVTVGGDRRYDVAVVGNGSDWWDIPPGDSHLRMIAAGASTPAQVSIAYADTYYL
jgi:hypothetical protein